MPSARFRRRVLLAGVLGPRIELSATSISEDAADNSVVGILSVANGSGTYTFSITSDPDNKFAIANDDELQIDELLDYETATSHLVTIEADNGVDDPISRVFTISVIDVEPEEFEAGNQTHESLEDFGAYIAGFADADTAPTAGGTLTINGAALGSYDYVIKDGNETISAFSNGDWFTATEDSRSAIAVVKGNLTIDAGQVLIPTNRKLFFLLYVTGDLAIAGGVSMSARGANHSAGAGNVTAADIRIIDGEHGAVTDPQVPAAGGAGGAANASNAHGNVGTAGTAGGSGGGGSGGRSVGGTARAGAAGTSFTGGSAGGGACGANTTPDPTAPSGASGGAGAVNASGSRAAGGGAGNPGGAGAEFGTAAGDDGSSGTGGVLVIICLGALSGAGTITANGANGGGGTSDDRGAGGGASGGGSVTVLYGSDTSSITPTANGGSGGSAQNPTGTPNPNLGGNGGAGTARKLELAA